MTKPAKARTARGAEGGAVSRDWNLQLEWKVQDFWIGAFWRRDGNCFDLWVCLLPCVPIHFSCWGPRWGMPSLDPDDHP